MGVTLALLIGLVLGVGGSMVVEHVVVPMVKKKLGK